ncbi:MAG: DNA internalization-related competence protein ComEC/Rec2 [Zoogloeaceae bacterium]|jgi:competence protein ComEC|nr:DNA internalization-related competence protein ComEC/Rec2 [Zoogloeaceae bacterium]
MRGLAFLIEFLRSPGLPHSGALGVVLQVAGLGGVLTLQQLPALPEHGLLFFCLGVLLGALCLCLRRRGGVFSFLALAAALVAGFALGFGWAAWRAELRLSDQLAFEWEGKDITLTGTVASLPVEFGMGQRFVFLVERLETPGLALGRQVPRRLWLSHYRRMTETPGPESDEITESTGRRMAVGERWQITVRLKRPHGTSNPDGFAYEAWLLERKLRATGYIRAAPPPARLAAPTAQTLLRRPMLAVHQIRARIRERFVTRMRDAPYGGILTALAIGDQQAISAEGWAVFNRTGTTHLMSISGLHVTLAALLVMWLTHRLWRFYPSLCRRLAAPRAAILAGTLAAFAYALLSGFGIPAQRTFLMLGVAGLALCSGRAPGSGRILLAALTVIWIFDPWAVLAPGFWLSFGSVAALVWVGTRLAAQPETPASLPERLRSRLGSGLRTFGHTQWAATLATLPILLCVFRQFPLAAPFANLLAIPLVSLVITPLTLLAALFCWGPGLLLLDLAHGILAPLMRLLEWCAAWPLWQTPTPAPWAVALAALAAPILLLPRGVPGKGAGLFLLLPLVFWPAPSLPPGTLRVTVLDVGQGSAVLLESAGHRLLYDTGPVYGPSRDADDAGRRVVLPYLVSRGIGRLDMLVLSHRDKDHSGGFESVRGTLAITRLLSSIPDLPGGEPCQTGTHWTWDGIRFEFLHPPRIPAGKPGEAPQGRNEDSCVLKVTTPSGRLLLTGDIEARTERRLLAAAAPLAAEVMLMPHHGSHRSSTPAFVAAVAPRWALASAGYRNRFNHPRPETLARYAAQGSKTRNTAEDGALILEFAQGKITLTSQRQQKRRYFQD